MWLKNHSNFLFTFIMSPNYCSLKLQLKLNEWNEFALKLPPSRKKDERKFSPSAVSLVLHFHFSRRKSTHEELSRYFPNGFSDQTDAHQSKDSQYKTDTANVIEQVDATSWFKVFSPLLYFASRVTSEIVFLTDCWIILVNRRFSKDVNLLRAILSISWRANSSVCCAKNNHIFWKFL